MKCLICITIILITVLAECPLSAQSYSIDWFTIDGGGGTSAGGVYSVAGTIGQPEILCVGWKR